MIKCSDDGLIEVSVSERKVNGKYDVSAKELIPAKVMIHIDIIFGPGDNFSRLAYNSQDAHHEWPDVAGTHLEHVQVIRINAATHY